MMSVERLALVARRHEAVIGVVDDAPPTSISLTCAANVSTSVTLPESSAAVAVMSLNVEPGSYGSVIARFFHASAGDAANRLGSKFGVIGERQYLARASAHDDRLAPSRAW